MRPLNDALPQAIRGMGLERQVRARAVVAKWRTAVGEVLARVSEATFLRSGILWVTVTDSVWQQELNMRKELIIARLNEALGAELVQDIRFRPGAVSAPAPRGEPVEEPWRPFARSAAQREWQETVENLRNCVIERQRAMEERGSPICPHCRRRFEGDPGPCPICRVK
ncbi:MAG: DUF721 domain-containing protein [Fimbriimonadia bacterium]|jgi:hypothetical protein